MQVADLAARAAHHTQHKEGGLASRLLREQAAESHEISASRTSVNILRVVQQFQLTVSEVKEISPYGLLALAYISASTRLSPEDRRTLIRLVAIVDEFAGGDPKLMRDIIGIAKIMEMNSKETYKPMPIREALRIYFEERERLDPSEKVTINVETQINALRIQHESVSVQHTAASGESNGLPEHIELTA